MESKKKMMQMNLYQKTEVEPQTENKFTVTRGNGGIEKIRKFG